MKSYKFLEQENVPSGREESEPLRENSSPTTNSQGSESSSLELSLRLPFPPTISPKDLVNNLLRSKSRSPKMLNEFFIYRKAFVQELKKKKLRPKMTKVSSFASTAWHNEPPEVKDEYRKIARETENLYRKEIIQRAKATTSEQTKPSQHIQPSPPQSTSNADSSSPDVPEDIPNQWCGYNNWCYCQNFPSGQSTYDQDQIPVYFPSHEFLGQLSTNTGNSHSVSSLYMPWDYGVYPLETYVPIVPSQELPDAEGSAHRGQ